MSAQGTPEVAVAKDLTADSSRRSRRAAARRRGASMEPEATSDEAELVIRLLTWGDTG